MNGVHSLKERTESKKTYASTLIHGHTFSSIANKYRKLFDHASLKVGRIGLVRKE